MTVTPINNGYIKGYKCLIGKSNLKLLIEIGGKFGNKDCRIYWDNWGNMFSDKKLFKCILDNINTKTEALEFIRLFNEFEAITFEGDRIKSNINIHNFANIQKVVNYVNSLNINDKLKRCLASMILRCYVDNNAYEPPKFNGCIRHYIQVLLLFGYKFDIKSWKMAKLNINSQDNIATIISDIGYPNNKYGIGKDDFNNKYRELFNSGKLTNLNSVE